MVRVRHAHTGDLPRMMELAQGAPGAAQWGRAVFERLFKDDSEAARLVLVLEEEKGEVAGFLAGRDSAGEWEIENLVVTGPARRRGLGSRLLGEFMHHARSRNARAVFLEVRESNMAARALYEKWAFCEAGRRKQYYQDPCEDALILKFSFPHP
ncbi:MAG TPA: ribosomal protein S18-alanine N-acetyltransferase [Candidatus Saccharimonadales bacterium]|jgi:ribosomal-protein-alanine N-acetyltransferase|nr:ribosomal protein S18-alanine N-acetyltransferase [Candidatus Saccharimonadales bacterium]